MAVPRFVLDTLPFTLGLIVMAVAHPMLKSEWKRREIVICKPEFVAQVLALIVLWVGKGLLNRKWKKEDEIKKVDS